MYIIFFCLVIFSLNCFSGRWNKGAKLLKGFLPSNTHYYYNNSAYIKFILVYEFLIIIFFEYFVACS